MTTTTTTAPGVTLRAHALLTVAALCWGGNVILGRLAVGQVSPLLLVSLRWLLVLALLLVLARRPLREDWPVMRTHLPMLMAMGALGFTGFNALFYVAAHSTTAVNMGIIQGCTPALVLAGAFVLDGVRVTRVQALGVALSLLGVAVVASGGEFSRLAALSVNHGDALMVGASLLYAGYTIALKRRPSVSPMAMLTVLSAAALAASLPLSVAEWLQGASRWPTPGGWLIITLIALLPSLLAQALFIQGVELIGPGRAALFMNLVPVFASMMGVALLHETFAVFHGLSLGLILGGIALSERTSGPEVSRHGDR